MYQEVFLQPPQEKDTEARINSDITIVVTQL